MTFIPTLDSDAKQRPRFPRVLNETEVRVLGSLMEKQLSTPEYYPLTLNALVAACNQKSNREPAMELAEEDVRHALDRLQDEKFVWKVLGGRAVRFDHNLDSVWHLNRKEKALITLLFLRGPQTAGELRGRSDRLHQFASPAEAEELLREMAAHSEPLVQQLTRRPGQKEERWAHTVGGAVAEVAVTSSSPAERAESVSERVRHLEERVAELETALNALRGKLGE
ncbi:MAG: YceH family protein [Thermoanaerobaculia bacterium]|nr:YceH family protein [Thermoanaerobaculia bacterium]